MKNTTEEAKEPYLEIVPPKGTSIVRSICQCVLGMKPKREETVRRAACGASRL